MSNIERSLNGHGMDFDRYQNDGFFVLPGVLAGAAMARALDRAMKLSGALAGHFAPAMQPHREDPNFLELMRLPSIVDIVETLVGGPALGIQTQFFYSMPGTRGFSAHQDNFFVEAPGDKFVSVWMPLVDVGPANGGLVIWPGSHNFGKLPVRPTHLTRDARQDVNANNEETVLPPGLAPIDLVAPKGSAVFLHAEVVHASHTNVSTEWRPVQLNTYVRAGTHFRPGNTARREEIPVRAAAGDPVR